jgi:hypothetical protein
MSCIFMCLGLTHRAAMIGPPNIGGEVTPGGGEKCSDAKICGPGKNVRIRTNLPTKCQNLFGHGLKNSDFFLARDRGKAAYFAVSISIPSRVKIHTQHVFGLRYVFPLHKFPVDYDPPHPECTDNSTDLSGVPPNFCSDCNRPHGNFGSKFVRTPEPTSPPIFGGQKPESAVYYEVACCPPCLPRSGPECFRSTLYQLSPTLIHSKQAEGHRIRDPQT